MASSRNLFKWISITSWAFVALYAHVCVYVTCYNVEANSNKVGMSRGEPNSQYGYSVGIVKKPGWGSILPAPTWWEKVLLVGAPNKTVTIETRTQSVSVKGHGEVEECYSTDKKNFTCSAIDLSINICDNLRGDNPNKSHCEENQRMGATIAINRNFEKVKYTTSTKPMVTICAPAWKNVLFEFETKIYQKYVVGICLKLRDELTKLDCHRRSLGFDYCWPFWPKKTTVFDKGPVYSYAQNGFAASFTLDGTSEIISAPGIDNWNGGFRAYQSGWTKRLQADPMSTMYYGYSITGANFKMGATVAAGIPNFYHNPAYGHFGMVEVLSQHLTAKVEFGNTVGSCPGVPILNPEMHLDVKQVGTKFGASVAAVDLTGDGYDELLVGAPLYSGQLPEEGRVFVYTTDDTDYTLCGPIGILSGAALNSGLKSMSRNARFGTSIAAAGDLNTDGFNDVAIGAPYEDEGSGAVYIYHGKDVYSLGPIKDEFSQRIAGREIDVGIKGFGWHIYGDEDVDGNGYPDLAVGAYASDQAVVLRTRPIVDMSSQIDISPSLIPLNGSQLACSRDGLQLCMNVTVSFRYRITKSSVKPDSPNPYETLAIHWVFHTDTLYRQREGTGRLVFRDTGLDFRNETIELSGEEYRKHYILDVKKYKNKSEPKDAWTPIRLRGEFSLVENNDPSFEVLNPILMADINRRVQADAEFDKKCESLDKCVSDLKTSVKLFVFNTGGHVTEVNQSSLLIVGESTELRMQVDVHNKMNTSYRANFSADVGLPIRRQVESQYGAVDATCKHDTSTYAANINCTADSKLDRNENFLVTAFFDTSHQYLVPGGDMDKMRQSVQVDVTAGQANRDVDVTNNDFHASIDVKLKYDVDVIEDKEISDQVRYKADEMSERMLPIVHRYYVINNGPSFLPRTIVNITVPLRNDDHVVAIIRVYSETIQLCTTATFLKQSLFKCSTHIVL